MKNFFISLSFILLFFAQANGQDRHFSQFYAAPLLLNPALTGAFDGKYRVNMIYRDQWRGVLDQPFKTFAANFDLRFPLTSVMQSKDAAGLGITFFSDKVGNLGFNTNSIIISGSFHKSLNPQNSQYLSVGVQGGISQRNVNYENFTFQDQFNGLTGYTFPSGELLPENSFAFGDLSVGLNYSFAPKDGVGFFAGVAMYHILQPKITFYDATKGGNAILPRRISAQTSANIPLSGLVNFSPRLLVQLQNKHLELNAGSNFRIQLSEDNRTALNLGIWARPVKTYQNKLELDALIGQLGFEYESLLFGFSYDANLSSYTTYKKGQGAFEISVTYIGNYDNDDKMCPSF